MGPGVEKPRLAVNQPPNPGVLNFLAFRALARQVRNHGAPDDLSIVLP